MSRRRARIPAAFPPGDDFTSDDRLNAAEES